MRVSEYPIPDYACYIWHRGDGVCLQLSDGRTIFLPLEKLATDSPGWNLLEQTMRVRRNLAIEGKKAAISTPSAPTELQVEAFLRGKIERQTKIDEDIFATEGE